MKRLHAAMAFAVIMMVPLASHAGSIRFMEGHNCTQESTGEASDKSGQSIKFSKTPGFKNDEAKSLQLIDVRAKAVIKVFDDPSGKTSDDYTEITVKKPIRTYCVGTFQKDLDDEFVTVTHHKHNGLDGKVSLLVVE